MYPQPGVLHRSQANIPISYIPALFLLGTLLTCWFKGVHYGARDEIISFLSSTALFLLLMGSPAASEARGDVRVLRKKELASNTRLTLRSCERESACFQHQMISDPKPQRRGTELARAQFSTITERLMLAWAAAHTKNRASHLFNPAISVGYFDAGTEFHYLGKSPESFSGINNWWFHFLYWLISDEIKWHGLHYVS